MFYCCLWTSTGWEWQNGNYYSHISPSCIIIVIVFFLQLSSQSFGAFRFITDFPVTCAKYVKSPCPTFSCNNMNFRSWKKIIKKRIKSIGKDINVNLNFVRFFPELTCYTNDLEIFSKKDDQKFLHSNVLTLNVPCISESCYEKKLRP